MVDNVRRKSVRCAAVLPQTAVALALCFCCGVASANTTERISSSGELVVGYRETSIPISFTSEKGVPSGYMVDVCARIFESVKLQFKRPALKLRFVPVKSAERIAAVKDGRIDIECASTTNTVDRQKEVAFSYTTFVAGVRFLTRTRDGKAPAVDELRGKKIGVTLKSSAEKLVLQISKEQNLGLLIVPAANQAEAFAKLAAGEVFAIAGDDALLVTQVAKAQDPMTYVLLGKYLSVEPYSVMHAKGDAEFARMIDSALLTIFATGELAKIHAKWFDVGGLKLPMNQYMKENIRLPNKYGVQQ